MNFSEYREAICKARSIPYKATSAILERQTVALEMAVARLNLLISEVTNSVGQVDVLLYSVKRQNILALQYTEIQTVALKIDIKDWFQMKVVAKGDTFEGYYSGELISEIKDKDLRKGKVGARVYDSTAHIDDLM